MHGIILTLGSSFVHKYMGPFRGAAVEPQYYSCSRLHKISHAQATIYSRATPELSSSVKGLVVT